MSLSLLALLSSGPLMLDIEKIFFAKDSSPVADGSSSSSSTTPKFHVMLGHDITLCPLISSLRLRGCDGSSLSQQWPPFARSPSPQAFVSQPTSSFAANTFCSALVFEKWRDDGGRAWAHVTFNGVSCVIGDAVARQVRHPGLDQPLHVFPMEVFELALEQVRAREFGASFCPFLSLESSYKHLQQSRYHLPQPLTLPPQHTALIKTIGIERLCRVRYTSHRVVWFHR